MKMKEIIAIAVGSLTLVGASFGAVTFMDNRHTPVYETQDLQEEVEVLAGSFKKFAIEQEIRNLRNRLWQLEKQKLCSSPNRVVREIDECNNLRTEIDAKKRNTKSKNQRR